MAATNSNVIAFQPGAVPAHIAEARAQGRAVSLNANASAGITGNFAYIGYKGRNWRLRYRGETTLLQVSAGTDHQGRPLPETPVQSLDVIIVGIAAHVSKQFYLKSYSEGDDNAPDCYSVNGIIPDAAVAADKRQHDTCSLCPQNRFGSKINDNGKKAKACADRRRAAVVPDGDPENEAFGGPMMLNMAQSSLANLDRYCRELERFGTDVTQVRTRMSFNLDVAYPEIIFTALGYIENPQDYETALAWSQSDEVHRMLEEELERAAPATVEHNATGSALTASRPAHLTSPQPTARPAQAAPQASPAPQARPASPFAQAQVKNPTNGSNGATTNGAAPASPQPARPRGRPPGSTNKPAATQAPAQAQVSDASARAVAAAGGQIAPAQEQAQVQQEDVQGPVEETQPVIQGAPDDMESAIDNLLS